MFPHIDAGATYIDSDTGLESMSSAEATTKACSLCLDGGSSGVGAHVQGIVAGMPSSEAGVQIDGLRQEVTRLKCDKLDLLRQNVVSCRLIFILNFFGYDCWVRIMGDRVVFSTKCWESFF